jgi:hypothetical protein
MPITALIDDLFGPTTPLLAQANAEWAATSRRFRAFLEANRAKVRKKARLLQDAEAERDLLCELHAAFLLLSDRRFTVEYEAHGLGARRAPDLTATYRTHPFHVEVKRIRTTAEIGAADAEAIGAKMMEVICDKTGQMIPDAVNLLWLAVDLDRPDMADLQAAMKSLVRRAEKPPVVISEGASQGKDYFAARGFRDAADFLRQSQWLSGILLAACWNSPDDRRVAIWTNPRARRPLPAELQRLLATVVSSC